jgi:AraC-like DNA-binding protein
MDALTTVFRMLRLEGKVFHRLELLAPWGIQLSVMNGAAFHVIEQGLGWLRMPERAEPICLEAGDVIVVSNSAYYELSDQPLRSTLPLSQVLKMRAERGGMRPSANGGGAVSTVVLCGEFRSGEGVLNPLFSVMPSLIHIKGQAGQAVEWLAPPLQLIAFEAKNAYPGQETVVSRLMDILFIMVIRYWIVHQPAKEGGWFAALYHPQIGAALGHIHRQPEQPWTVETLAAAVNMSRSSLATQFAVMVGESPAKYLTRWRMQLAAMWLRHEQDLTVEAVAQRVGYDSAYAFSKAFKRLMGVSPSVYRNHQLAAYGERLIATGVRFADERLSEVM